MFPVENPGLCTVHEGGNGDGSAYLDLHGEAERMTLPYCLWQSSKETAGFGYTVVDILADCGLIGDDATDVNTVFQCRESARKWPSFIVQMILTNWMICLNSLKVLWVICNSQLLHTCNEPTTQFYALETTRSNKQIRRISSFFSFFFFFFF